jgi:hypothetical protein
MSIITNLDISSIIAPFLGNCTNLVNTSYQLTNLSMMDRAIRGLFDESMKTEATMIDAYPQIINLFSYDVTEMDRLMDVCRALKCPHVVTQYLMNNGLNLGSVMLHRLFGALRVNKSWPTDDGGKMLSMRSALLSLDPSAYLTYDIDRYIFRDVTAKTWANMFDVYLSALSVIIEERKYFVNHVLTDNYQKKVRRTVDVINIISSPVIGLWALEAETDVAEYMIAIRAYVKKHGRVVSSCMPLYPRCISQSDMDEVNSYVIVDA